MFGSRTLNNLINKTQESSLRRILNGADITGNDITREERNIQVLQTEVFQTSENLFPSIKGDMFDARAKLLQLGGGKIENSSK